MEQYIPKSALLAEIERLDTLYHTSKSLSGNLFIQGLFCFIDTLEVKEVDLNEEIKSYFKGFGKFPSVGIDDCIDIAKYFFELGLRSTITEKDCKLIWNIGDEIPYMPEEEFFKELLRRYKIKKGE